MYVWLLSAESKSFTKSISQDDVVSSTEKWLLMLGQTFSLVYLFLWLQQGYLAGKGGQTTDKKVALWEM